MNSPAIGIDFGTSTLRSGMPTGAATPWFASRETIPTYPSAIFFDLDDGTVLFGRSAAQRHIDGHRGRFMRSMKSVLGSSLMEEKTRIGPQSVSFASIIGLFIGHLKSAAETHLGQTIDRGVFGRPVFFVDGDEAADRAAAAALEASARRQGFKEIQFQYEPIAAALDYERTCTREELAIVVDVGGGTATCHSCRLVALGRLFAPRIIGFPWSSRWRHGLRSRLEPANGDAPVGLPIANCRGFRVTPVAMFQITSSSNSLHGTRSISIMMKNIAAVKSVARTALAPEKLEMLVKVLENQQGHDIANRVEKAKIDLTFAETTQAAIPVGT